MLGSLIPLRVGNSLRVFVGVDDKQPGEKTPAGYGILDVELQPLKSSTSYPVENSVPANLKLNVAGGAAYFPILWSVKQTGNAGNHSLLVVFATKNIGQLRHFPQSNAVGKAAHTLARQNTDSRLCG